jgi:hypothetical protein
LLPEVLEAVGQNVSVAYVYRLMQRHERRRGPVVKPTPAKPGNEADALPSILEAMHGQPPSAMPAPNPLA